MPTGAPASSLAQGRASEAKVTRTRRRLIVTITDDAGDASGGDRRRANQWSRSFRLSFSAMRANNCRTRLRRPWDRNRLFAMVRTSANVLADIAFSSLWPH